jgi:poly(3-hydroxybutyrate) depolymerase
MTIFKRTVAALRVLGGRAEVCTHVPLARYDPTPGPVTLHGHNQTAAVPANLAVWLDAATRGRTALLVLETEQ